MPFNHVTENSETLWWWHWKAVVEDLEGKKVRKTVRTKVEGDMQSLKKEHNRLVLKYYCAAIVTLRLYISQLVN